jgi:hypothetical protein
MVIYSRYFNQQSGEVFIALRLPAPGFFPKAQGGIQMKKGLIFKMFVYFLAVSCLLLMNEFTRMIAEANQTIPVGRMVSHGGVKFQVKENSWEKVETPFPVFEGMKIRTEEGEAVLALAQKTRIEVGSDSVFYFDQRDQFNLLQGKVSFRVQPDVPLRFKAGNLSISKSYPLQTAKGSFIALTKDMEFAGSILMHSKGSVTVKSIQGSLSVTDSNGALVASLSTGESITLPSVVASSKSPTLMANAQPKLTEGAIEEEGFLGLSTWTWVGIADVAAFTGAAIAVSASGRGADRGVAPVCP